MQLSRLAILQWKLISENDFRTFVPILLPSIDKKFEGNCKSNRAAVLKKIVTPPDITHGASN